jgi:hypothetical protein
MYTIKFDFTHKSKTKLNEHRNSQSYYLIIVL